MTTACCCAPPCATTRPTRDLLHDGLLAEAGVGDVRVWPQAWHDGDHAGGHEMVLIELRSPDGQATLAIDAADLEAFLCRTLDAVPRPPTSTSTR